MPVIAAAKRKLSKRTIMELAVLVLIPFVAWYLHSWYYWYSGTGYKKAYSDVSWPSSLPAQTCNFVPSPGDTTPYYDCSATFTASIPDETAAAAASLKAAGFTITADTVTQQEHWSWSPAGDPVLTGLVVAEKGNWVISISLDQYASSRYPNSFGSEVDTRGDYNSEHG